jgi:hypothetical protein
MYIRLGNCRKLFTQAFIVQTQQDLFLFSFSKFFAPLGDHTIYLCHREFTPWQNDSVVGSAVW